MPVRADDAGAIRVILVDDHPIVRAGVAAVLAREEIDVCAEAESRAQASRALDRFSPELAVVDLSLGRDSGLDLIAELDDRGIRVLVYSMHEDGEQIRRALAAGACGYVTKREMHQVLVDAVRAVAAGEEYLGPRAAAALASRLTGAGRRHGHGDLDSLSEREQQVYHLLGEGATISEIAAEMHISTRTAESYCARMMEKLDLSGMRPLRRDAIHHLHDTGE